MATGHTDMTEKSRMPLATTFTTLGTAGGPTPKLTRSSPAHLVMHKDLPILVDCGEGAMRQLMRAGIDFRQVHNVILTHHHFDHIGSLFTCLGINMMMQRKKPLNIYGPPGTRQIIDGLSAACDVPREIGFGVAGQTLPHPKEFVHVQEILPGDEFEIGEIRVSCCENTHYRSEDQFGTDGSISLSLRFDAPDRSIVFTGDTGPCKGLEEFAKGAQLLVGELIDVEGTMAAVRKQNAHMTAERIEMMCTHMAEHHLTADQLGHLASCAGVEHVVAVHITINTITPDTASEYVEKIAAIFSGAITIAEDLQRF